MGASPILGFLCLALQAFSWVLLIWVVLSWATLFGFRPPIDGPVRALIDLVEAIVRPVLRPLRSMMPPLQAGGVGLDLSVLVAFVIIQVAQRIVC